MKFNLGRLVFNCPLFLIAVYALLVVLLLNLGFWQLTRAEEKRGLITQQVQSTMAEVLTLTTATSDSPELLRYRKVSVLGHYDTKQQFLLDNQVNAGKVGYFVLTPFILAGGQKAVLVNRGWIALTKSRTQLPDVQFKGTQNMITGRINFFPGVGFKLTGAEIPSNTSPAVVQVVNSEILAKKLGYPLFSFQLELDANQADGYERQWSTTTLMAPQQHFGYALQWFALAFTLTLLFFWYSFKKQQ